MNSVLLVFLISVLCLCGSAWGKAFDPEHETEGKQVDVDEFSETGVDEMLDDSDYTQSSSPCLYKGKIFTINVKKIANRFKGMNITTPDGRYIYFLSLCSPIACSFDPNQEDKEDSFGCQYIVSQEYAVSLGRSDFEWHIVNTTYFYVLFNNGDPSTDPSNMARRLQVGFKANDGCIRRPTIQFDGEVESTESRIITYVFTINIKMDEVEYLSVNEDVEI